ncbi:hypothetical protein SEA_MULCHMANSION_114 [Streptomyces phage MulchMansion]|nr:hypothetical protein SEA_MULCHMANSION_114 [Streptomyces phage MulchMansion]
MSREEEIQFYNSLKKNDLPAKQREYDNAVKALRGLTGPALLKGQKHAGNIAMELGGIKNTMKAIKERYNL